MNATQREYKALVCRRDEPERGERTSVWAADLDDAVRQLELTYGPGAVVSVWNEEDANRPR